MSRRTVKESGEPLTALERERRSRQKLRGTPVPPTVTHGGRWAYQIYGCRCPECVEWKRAGRACERNQWRLTAYGHWSTEGDRDVLHWPPAGAKYPWVCPTCDYKIEEEIR